MTPVNWQQLLVDHIRDEENRWDHLDNRLDSIEKQISFWKGGLAAMATILPFVVSLVTAYVFLFLERS